MIEMRDATKEEQESIDRYIDSISETVVPISYFTTRVKPLVYCKYCVHNQLPSTSANIICELFYEMDNPYGFCYKGELKDNE